MGQAHLGCVHTTCSGLQAVRQKRHSLYSRWRVTGKGREVQRGDDTQLNQTQAAAKDSACMGRTLYQFHGGAGGGVTTCSIHRIDELGQVQPSTSGPRVETTEQEPTLIVINSCTAYFAARLC
ncbi:uncharacterized protein LOC144536526 [Sander vitreus]